MTREGVGQEDFKDGISRAAHSFVALWAVGLLLLYGIGGYFGIRTLQGYRAETEKLREALIASQTIEPGTKAPEISISKKPVEVRVGIHINRIGEFDLRGEAGRQTLTSGSAGAMLGSGREKPSRSLTARSTSGRKWRPSPGEESDMSGTG